jgi:hypothetical protein
MQQFLYYTVTAEKAAKHIVASKIRNWPHRATLSASSSCCMNLYMRRTRALRLLGKTFVQGIITLDFICVRLFVCIFIRIRSSYGETLFTMDSVSLSEMRCGNNSINISPPCAVKPICLLFPYELTPLFPDGVECTHLT